MKIAIVGSRTFYDQPLLRESVSKELDISEIDLIVSGGAKGADSLAEKFADENNISKQIFYPEWSKYGKGAGYIRNKLIIENVDIVFAFWDGKSKGTKHSINLAKELNKQLFVIKIK